VKYVYAFYLVFPRFFRPWFRDPRGMTTSLIAFCCQTASRAGLAQLTRQTWRHVWAKNIGYGGGRRGRRDKLLRLLSAAKLLAEGGGGKPKLSVGWQETSSRPSYASVYFSKSRPRSTVAGH